MLEVKNLYAEVHGKPILQGLDLTINPGEVHAIMGPNGSGKSTFANVITGKAGYTITQGEILFKQQNIAKLSVEARAQLGLFLGLQYPTEIPGVTNIYFLKTALNEIRKIRSLEPLDAIDFMAKIDEHIATLRMDKELLYRAVNTGFSGGEKKRNEILQMLTLEPDCAILDETDSGLDIDALRVIADGVNSLRDDKRGFIIITHYQRLLDYIVPDVIHILANGRIIQSGDKSLALILEQHGYQPILESQQ